MLALEAPRIVALPEPISTNHLFVNLPPRAGGGRGGRVMAPEYKDWRKRADEWLMCQRPLPRFAMPVAVTLYAGEVGVGNMDAGNVEKAVVDAIVRAEIIRDDSRKWLRRLAVVWTPGLRGTLAHLRSAPADPDLSAILAQVEQNVRELVCGCRSPE